MQLPIFPLVSEIHGISLDGATLDQVWDLVSMPEFYDTARFARVSWLDSTWQIYLALAVVHHIVLIGVFLLFRSLLKKLFNQNK